MTDAPRITPPVLKPGFRSGHDVDIAVTIQAGVPLGEVVSSSHRILVERSSLREARVRVADDDAIPNKDFMLRWQVASDMPAVGLLAHREEGEGFFTLLVQPRAEVSVTEAAPKEIVLAIDTSGSMQGIPLDASKRFIRKMLQELGPRDTFNLVRFSGDNEVYAETPRPNEPGEVEAALRWVMNLRGSGGTEMLAALRRSFELPPDPNRLRLVIFLTDGEIGNEDQILSEIASVVGSARIYTVGIGSSVNHYLLDRMATLGRGGYVFVCPDNRSDDVLEAFRSWVSRPYLTDLTIDWGALPVADLSPARLPDLYSGQTLTVVGRYLAAGKGEIVLRGRLAGSYWEQRLNVVLPERETRHEALGAVWARWRIESLLLSEPAGASDTLRAEVTALALEHRLLCPFTSFVAVDRSRVVEGGGNTPTVEQALPLPEGVSFEGIFGKQGPPGLQAESTPSGRAAARSDTENLTDELPEENSTGESPEDGGTPAGHGALAALVVDETNVPFPGVVVTLTNTRGLEPPRSLLTNAEGRALFNAVHPGKGYRVTVEIAGYESIDEMDITVRKATVHRAYKLQPQRTETVTVHAEESTADDSESTTISAEFFKDLPILGQNVQSALTLAPGAQDDDADYIPNVHAARERDFGASLEGVSNVDPLTGTFVSNINYDAMEEIEIVTTGADATYGRAVGGFANIISKQGSSHAQSSGGLAAVTEQVSPRRPPRVRRASLLDAALRVLADVADDGRLTASEGIPALAALLAAQQPSGALSEEVAVHAIATWALAEAAAMKGADPWVVQAANKATAFLLGLRSPEGWPAMGGGRPDAEATRWARLVLEGLPPKAATAGASPKGEASSLYDRLAGALAGSKPSTASGSSSGAGNAVERFLACARRGHLKAPAAPKNTPSRPGNGVLAAPMEPASRPWNGDHDRRP